MQAEIYSAEAGLQLGLTDWAPAVIAKVSSEMFKHRLKLECELDLEHAKKSGNHGW